MGALYQIQFPNGKRYIGITCGTALDRFKKHVSNITRTGRGETAICRALRKYGSDAVTLKTLVVADDWIYLQLIEQRAIKAFGTRAPFGYNFTDGGEGALGHEHNLETRERMAKIAEATWALPDFQKKMSAIRLGKKQSQETCRRRSESVRAAWARPGYRETLSAVQIEAQNRPGVREKRIAAIKKSWQDPKRRALQCEVQSSPRMLAMKSSRAKELWSDPEKRKEIIAAQNAGKERAKLERNSRS